MEQLVQFLSDGQLVRGKFQSPANKSPCILMSHGFESSMDGNKWQLFVPWFSRLGYATLRFNYRGCGEGDNKSEGKFENTTLTARIADYQAALGFLQSAGVDTQRIAVIGSSFGAMIILAAPDVRIKAAIVLAAPYYFPLPSQEELANIKKEGYFLLSSGKRLLPSFLEDLPRYDVLRKVKEIKQPLLIFHGGQDELVSVESARKIYSAVSVPRRLEILEGADHSFTDYRYCEQIMKISRDWFHEYL